MGSHSMCKGPEAEENSMPLQNSISQNGWGGANDRRAGGKGEHVSGKGEHVSGKVLVWYAGRQGQFGSRAERTQ